MLECGWSQLQCYWRNLELLHFNYNAAYPVKSSLAKSMQPSLYHTKTILTNQVALFEGYNGSYFPPRHVPKIRTAFSMAQVSYITCWRDVSRMTRYISRERASALVKSLKRLALPSALPRLHLSAPGPKFPRVITGHNPAMQEGVLTVAYS